MKKILGITGSARAGKDSVFSFLQKHTAAYRVAFADELKKAVDPICKDLFGISAFTPNTDEKAIIRDFLVATGNTARKVNHRVWINKVVPVINKLQCLRDMGPIVITDARFQERDGDELDFVQREIGGTIIYVDRIMPDGTKLQPANASEAKNDPILRERADIYIVASNLEELENQVVAKILPLFRSVNV